LPFGLKAIECSLLKVVEDPRLYDSPVLFSFQVK
jgi:hypothetical protein